LKTRSQRADVGRTHDPGYGHIPVWYLVQVVTPWMWYAPDVNADEALTSIRTLTYPAATNKVEAHLYFGLVPLGMAVIGLWRRRRDGEPLPVQLRIWLWIGVAGVVYATGWLLPVTRHLPGFSFFIGPGRYGILTTLAVGLLAGDVLDRWVAKPQATFDHVFVIAVVLGLTIVDLWNAVPLEPPQRRSSQLACRPVPTADNIGRKAKSARSSRSSRNRCACWALTRTCRRSPDTR
jgi:uncharacterized membrane protein